MKVRNQVFAVVAVSLVAGCSDPAFVLPGKREDLRPDQHTETVNQTRAVRLPAQSRNAAWTHRIGTPSHRISHAALSAEPALVWSASIGKGETRRLRITADPVVTGGRIFTVDSEALLVATSTDGARLWSRDLTPSRDKPADATGGGIAYGNGKLFVSTGFGRLKAIDPANGLDIWEQRLQAVGSGTPTVYKDRVYLVSGDDTAWAINAETGKVDWRLSSVPDVTSIQSPSAPAVNDKLAIFAFGSGEVQAAFRRGGVRLWDAGISGQRAGYAAATISDISGDPVIDGRTVYAANHSGRLVALNIDNGQRLWTANEGAVTPVWPVGGSVYLISERNRLIRLDARSGEIIWAIELPLFKKDKPKKQSGIYAHYGPVLAGGRLVVASSDGLLRSFAPESGALMSTVEIPGGAASGMAISNGTLYVVGTKGQLHAFR